MKSNAKLKIIILITLGILFALAPKITLNPSLITGNNNVINLDNRNLKISELSRKIRIINNSGWVDFRNAGNCTGSGTYSDPYVIEDLEIDAGGVGSPIWVENSNVYFKIENCSVYNCYWHGPDLIFDAGIRLLNVNNSQLIGNDCSSNYLGIDLSSGCYNNTVTDNILNNNGGGLMLFDGYYNTISGNTVNNNTWGGIYLLGGSNNTISGNTMNDNSFNGIQLYGGSNNIVSGNTANNNENGIALYNSSYNTISGNTANNNENGIFFWYSKYNNVLGNTANNNEYGIYLSVSKYNTISGNTLKGNDKCIFEEFCQENIFQNNDCTLTPSLNYLPIILTIIITIVGVSVFIIYQNGKKFKKIREELEFL